MYFVHKSTNINKSTAFTIIITSMYNRTYDNSQLDQKGLFLFESLRLLENWSSSIYGSDRLRKPLIFIMHSGLDVRSMLQ